MPKPTQKEIQETIRKGKAALERSYEAVPKGWTPPSAPAPSPTGIPTREEIQETVRRGKEVLEESYKVVPKATPGEDVVPEDLGLDEKVDDVGVTSDEARRARIEKEAKEAFGDVDIGERPALPTYEADFEALRSKEGMAAIETRMTSITDEIRQLEDQTRADLRTEEGTLAPMSLIGLHQQEIIKDRQEQIDALIRSKAVLVEQYNTKATIINQTMSLKQMDYAAATADYNNAFNQAIQIQNLIEGRITKEEQIENQIKDDARANLNIITKSMTDSGKIWDDLDLDIQTLIKTLELKSEFPSGIIQAFMNEHPGMSVDYTASGYDATGNQVISFFSYNNGNPKLIKTVKTGAIKTDKPTVTEETASLKKGFIADKKDGMGYEEAIDTYGHVLSLDYIDRMYNEGKYKETGKERVEREFYEEIDEWDRKVEEQPDKYKKIEKADRIIYKEYVGTVWKRWKKVFEYELE